MDETLDPPCSNILYIEDNAANVRLMERIFARRSDLWLIVATSGLVGLDIVRDTRPSVVMLDMQLPDINGDVVLKCLRGDELTAGIPVVVVSADAVDRHIQQVLEAGASRYVTKPYDAHHLLAVIDDLLRGLGGKGRCN